VETVLIVFKGVSVSKFEWVRNRFAANNVCILTTCEQEKLRDKSCDGSLKDTSDAEKNFLSFGYLWKKTTQFYRSSFCDKTLVRNWIFCCCCHGNKISISFDNTKELRVAFSSMTPQFGKLHRKGSSSITQNLACAPSGP